LLMLGADATRSSLVADKLKLRPEARFINAQTTSARSAGGIDYIRLLTVSNTSNCHTRVSRLTIEATVTCSYNTVFGLHEQ